MGDRVEKMISNAFAKSGYCVTYIEHSKMTSFWRYLVTCVQVGDGATDRKLLIDLHKESDRFFSACESMNVTQPTTYIVLFYSAPEA